MPNIKEYNVKLKSLKNTRKITKTMKMVSASKLRRAQQAQVSAKLYAQNLTALVSRISAAVQKTSHPLLETRKEIKKALIIVFTSDKGLCGAFNHNAHKQVIYWMRDNNKQYEKIDLSFCGKRGFTFFRKRVNVRSHYENVTGRPEFAYSTKIGEDVVNSFIKGEYDEVYLAYNQFFSPISQKTIFEKILPIDPKALFNQGVKGPAEYIFEPQATTLLEFLIPHFVYFKIHFALLENSAGEHGARMSAMDNATKNCSDLMNRYTLLRNRARQAAITTELTEIVAGAEALK